MLTLWVIFVTIGSLFFVGLPITKILYDSQNVDEVFWIKAPFIGLASIVLVLQNLVYLDIHIGLSTPWLWAGVCFLWVWLVKTGRLASVFSAMPRPLLTSALGVYLIQGLGLLLVGAKYYVGRAWIDQFNYTAMTQFLMDYPFSTTFDEIGFQPYLFKAISLKRDRIGQSVFHGFLATSTLTDAKTTFEPAILIAPFLIVLAVYLLARHLSQPERPALLAAVIAGVLPAISMMHLESFFSHVLGTPLLLIWPFVVSKAIEQPTWNRLLLAALILAAGTSIYTEFYVIFIGIGVLVVGLNALRQRQQSFSYIRSFTVLIVIAFLLNPGFAQGVIGITRRISFPGVLAAIYPWAYSIEGLQRLWLGDMAVEFSLWLQLLLGVVSLGLLLATYLGLSAAFLKKQDGVALAVLVLATLPWLVRIRSGYQYQFYKLLLSVSPLLTLGIYEVSRISGLKIRLLRNNGRSGFIVLFAFSSGNVVGQTLGLHARLSRIIGHIGLIVLFALVCAGTIDMTFRSGAGQTVEEIGRGGAHKLLSPATKAVQDKLAEMHNQDIYIVWEDDFYQGGFVNAWLAYFARHNRVWLYNPILSDADLSKFPQAKQSPENLPDDFFMLTSLSRVFGHSLQLIWSADPYHLWQLSSGEDWLFLRDFINANGLEDWGGELGFWLGQGDTEIDLIASRNGQLEISGYFTPGPSLPDKTTRRILITTDQGYNREVTLDGEGTHELSIPVTMGQNSITLRPLDKPTLDILPNGDTRPLLVGIRGLHIVNFQ